MSTEVHQAAETVTTSNELDLLFGPLFDEYLNGENQVVLKSSAVDSTSCIAFDKRQQLPDSTSSTSTLATSVTADGNFDFPTLDSAGSYVMQGAPFTQWTIPSIPVGGSISPEGFLLSVLLLVVIIVTVVVVIVILIVVVDDVSLILKLSFVIIGVPVALRGYGMIHNDGDGDNDAYDDDRDDDERDISWYYEIIRLEMAFKDHLIVVSVTSYGLPQYLFIDWRNPLGAIGIRVFLLALIASYVKFVIA
ncbi:hypothetical protein Tco_0859871 [Tanacetum coccineum]|uniref:Transmembrane protein n=1 Tax=Tanacetum coccineum TaxID=301880 RepID=A0ABQ5BF27_9ASTR